MHVGGCEGDVGVGGERCYTVWACMHECVSAWHLGAGGGRTTKVTDDSHLWHITHKA